MAFVVELCDQVCVAPLMRVAALYDQGKAWPPSPPALKAVPAARREGGNDFIGTWMVLMAALLREGLLETPASPIGLGALSFPNLRLVLLVESHLLPVPPPSEARRGFSISQIFVPEKKEILTHVLL